MIKKFFTFSLCIILTCLFIINSYASTQMIIGVDTAGIYGSDSLKGTPTLFQKYGESLLVSPFNDNVMSVHGHEDIISGYCDKNDLIYANTLYFAETALQVSSGKYSYLVDTAKYMYLFKIAGLEFKNSDDHPMLIQQDTFFRLQSLATDLDKFGYKTVVTRAYQYTDENGTKNYAKGARLDFEIYTGSIKVSIPLPEYDDSGNVTEYSEIEQLFIDNGFVRIDNSSTFEDKKSSSFLAYEVDFDKLSYVIMD